MAASRFWRLIATSPLTHLRGGSDGSRPFILLGLACISSLALVLVAALPDWPRSSPSSRVCTPFWSSGCHPASPLRWLLIFGARPARHVPSHSTRPAHGCDRHPFWNGSRRSRCGSTSNPKSGVLDGLAWPSFLGDRGCLRACSSILPWRPVFGGLVCDAHLVCLVCKGVKSV